MGYSTIGYKTQVGIETTPGTPVQATKRLTSLTIVPSPTAGNALPETTGRHPTIAVPTPEMTNAEVTGVADFATLALLFTAMFGHTTATQQGTTTAYKRTWTPGQWSEVTMKTLTVEHGKDGSGNAVRFSYGLLKDFSLGFDRNKAGPPSFSGAMVGKALETGVTLSSGASDFAGPALPNKATIYLDSTPGAIGTTAWADVLSATLNVKGWWDAFLKLAQDNTDFEVLEVRNPSVSLELTALTSTTGFGLFTSMRNASTLYLVLKCQGPLIADTYYYALNVYLPCAIAEAPSFRHDDNRFVIRLNASAKYDSTLQYGIKVELTNEVQTL